MAEPAGYKPPALENPYEQVVRVSTALFSVLVGFALKDLLTPTRFGGEESGPPLAFVATLFLVLRFLVGSANHLWIESLDRSARANQKSAAWIFTWHLGCLIAFGLLALRLCHSTEIREFLRWNVGFCVTAAIVSVISVLVEKKVFFKLSPRWLWINLLQAVLFWVFASWNVNHVEEMFGIKYNVILLLAAIVSGAGLIADLQFQVRSLEKLAIGPDTKESPNTGAEASPAS